MYIVTYFSALHCIQDTPPSLSRAELGRDYPLLSIDYASKFPTEAYNFDKINVIIIFVFINKLNNYFSFLTIFSMSYATLVLTIYYSKPVYYHYQYYMPVPAYFSSR